MKPKNEIKPKAEKRKRLLQNPTSNPLTGFASVIASDKAHLHHSFAAAPPTAYLFLVDLVTQFYDDAIFETATPIYDLLRIYMRFRFLPTKKRQNGIFFTRLPKTPFYDRVVIALILPDYVLHLADLVQLNTAFFNSRDILDL